MTQPPTPAPAWTDLGRGIRVRTSPLYVTNSVVLEHAEHTVLVDPAVLPSELDDIRARVRAVGPAEVTLLLTHPDWDHVLGRPWWPEARVIAHDGFAATLRRTVDRVRSEAERHAAEHGERWPQPFAPYAPDLAASGLHYRALGPWHVVFREAPGHHPEMLSIHLPEHRTLLAADMLSDIEIPMLQSPPDVYRRTLETLWPLAERDAIQTLVPGHGSIARGADAVRARFRHDLDYLAALQSGAAEALRAGASADDAWTRLERMSYTGKDAEYSMNAVHRRNAEITCAALASATAARSRAPGR